MSTQISFWTGGSDRVCELEQLIDLYPEWLIYGTWDTPRCLACGGFKNRGGHRDNCKRNRFEKEKVNESSTS